MKTFNHDEFEAILVEEEYDEHARGLIQKWIARGDSVAVYQNEDLGHHLLGLRVLVSYGSSAAQLEARNYSEPPKTLPDGLMSEVTGGINWRYCFQGLYAPQSVWPHAAESS